MLKIAICDDEKKIIDELYEMINEILQNYKYYTAKEKECE